MKNHWLSQKNKKSFSKKMLEEAKQLEKVWTKMGIIDTLRQANKNHWLDGDLLTNEK